MGNCQAAEAVAVVQHPGNGKIERMYWSISANEVMCSNPGHYVALVVVESSNPSSPVKHQLKLLKPTDTLHVGQVYRLISFEGLSNKIQFYEFSCYVSVMFVFFLGFL